MIAHPYLLLRLRDDCRKWRGAPEGLRLLEAVLVAAAKEAPLTERIYGAVLFKVSDRIERGVFAMDRHLTGRVLGALQREFFSLGLDDPPSEPTVRGALRRIEREYAKNGKNLLNLSPASLSHPHAANIGSPKAA